MSEKEQEVITHTSQETGALAARVVEVLAIRERSRGTSTIVALSGELGVGKTVFAQGVAAALGVEEVVTSPTFVIEKVYRLPKDAPWKHLVHIDAYRLEGEEELATIDWHNLATDPGNLILIEWPEQVGMGVPERAYRIRFEEVDEQTRRLRIDKKL